MRYRAMLPVTGTRTTNGDSSPGRRREKSNGALPDATTAPSDPNTSAVTSTPVAITVLAFGFCTMPLMVSVPSLCSYARVRSSRVVLPPLGGATDVVAGDSVATLRVNELAVKPYERGGECNRRHDTKPPRPRARLLPLGEQSIDAGDGRLQIQLNQRLVDEVVRHVRSRRRLARNRLRRSRHCPE